MKDLKKKVNERVQKNYVQVGVCKMKTNTYFVIFSNASFILEVMLFNRNLRKLIYQALLSSDCRALALKLSECLKKGTHFP